MVKALIQPLISSLAAGYAELYKEQKNFETLKKCGKEEFFGLRDFYRFVILELTFLLASLAIIFDTFCVNLLYLINLFCLFT